MEERVDLRVIKTREAIEGAFVRLLRDKPFERVTVQDILDEARVTAKRSTNTMQTNTRSQTC